MNLFWQRYLPEWFLVNLGPSHQQKKLADYIRLQGIWTPTFILKGCGKGCVPTDIPSEMLWRFTVSFVGHLFMLELTKRTVFFIDPMKTPKEINFRYGFEFYRGIYELSDNSLAICWYKGKGDPRPEELNRSDNYENVFYMELAKTH